MRARERCDFLEYFRDLQKLEIVPLDDDYDVATTFFFFACICSCMHVCMCVCFELCEICELFNACAYVCVYFYACMYVCIVSVPRSLCSLWVMLVLLLSFSLCLNALCTLFVVVAFWFCFFSFAFIGRKFTMSTK